MQNERPLFSAPTKITRWPSITGGPNSHHSDNALGHRVLCICAFTWLIPALLASTKFLILLPWVLAGHWGVTVVARVGDTGKTLRCLSYPMVLGGGGWGETSKASDRQNLWNDWPQEDLSPGLESVTWPRLVPKNTNLALEISKEARLLPARAAQSWGREGCAKQCNQGHNTWREKHLCLSPWQCCSPSRCLEMCAWAVSVCVCVCVSSIG